MSLMINFVVWVLSVCDFVRKRCKNSCKSLFCNLNGLLCCIVMVFELILSFVLCFMLCVCLWVWICWC